METMKQYEKKDNAKYHFTYSKKLFRVLKNFPLLARQYFQL